MKTLSTLLYITWKEIYFCWNQYKIDKYYIDILLFNYELICFAVV